MLEKVISGEEISTLRLFRHSADTQTLMWAALGASLRDGKFTILLHSERNTTSFVRASKLPDNRLKLLNYSHLLDQSDIISAILKLVKGVFDGEAVSVFIDSLDSLILTYDSHLVSRLLSSIRQGRADSSIAANVHKDVHSDGINSVIEYYATTVIDSLEMQNSDCVIVTILHRRPSGKVSRFREIAKLTDRFTLETCSSLKGSEVVESDDVTVSNQFSALTFDVRLSADERTARSQVRLPYVLSYEEKERMNNAGEKSGGGVIHYEPDEYDDYDEEDPDDDLDI